jgi:DNA-binding response OmpR family regulator
MVGGIARAARVLVIDDEHEIADTMAELLNAEGYSVSVAYDGAEAMQEIPKFNPHLILLDLMMPRMGGFEVLKRLRENRYATLVSSPRRLIAPTHQT